MNFRMNDQLDRLWITNATPVGTYALSMTRTFDPNRPAGAESVAALKDLFLFTAGKWNPDGSYDWNNLHIWRSDGTVKGTYVLR